MPDIRNEESVVVRDSIKKALAIHQLEPFGVCEQCIAHLAGLHIFNKRLTEAQKHLTTSIDRLTRSYQETDCPLCLRLGVVLESETQVLNALFETGSPFDEYRFLFLEGVAGEAYFTFETTGVCHAHLFQIVPASNGVSASDTIIHPAQLDIGSDRAFDLAHQWLTQCEKTCGACTELSSDNAEYPSYLVDVSTNSSDNDLSLVDTKANRRSPYITLSYCWGAIKQPQATRQANLAGRISNGFRLDQQPATIRDAVVVARKMGYRLIWVDSLCIVQDSRSQKLEEIHKMKSIFENSQLTIVASSAQHVDEGFLGDRVRDDSEDILCLPLWSASGQVARVDIRPMAMYPAQQEDPIHTRAWTFEEWLLSRRLLVYTRNQLVWCCHGFEKCDGGDNFGPSPPRGPYHAFLQGSPNEPDSTGIELWNYIVNRYTGRGLSLAPDRLLAIQGIAESMAVALKMDYIYGLWLQDFISGLCWTCDPSHSLEDSAHLEGVLDCPSWSWASVYRRVSYRSKLKPVATLITHDAPLYRSLPSSKGRIAIEGPYFTYVDTYTKHALPHNHDFLHGKCSIYLDRPVTDPFDKDHLGKIEPRDIDPRYIAPKVKLFLLLRCDDTRPYNFDGLILKAVSTDRSFQAGRDPTIVYTRSGIFTGYCETIERYQAYQCSTRRVFVVE